MVIPQQTEEQNLLSQSHEDVLISLWALFRLVKNIPARNTVSKDFSILIYKLYIYISIYDTKLQTNGSVILCIGVFIHTQTFISIYLYIYNVCLLMYVRCLQAFILVQKWNQDFWFSICVCVFVCGCTCVRVCAWCKRSSSNKERVFPTSGP